MVDDDAVCCSDLQDWSAEFDRVTDHFSFLFARPRSRAHARAYLEGLLAPIERKNGWTIAEHAGEPEPKAMQRFLNLAAWDADAMRDMGRDYAISNFGDPRAVLVADPTGFAKKGNKSARCPTAVLRNIGTRRQLSDRHVSGLRQRRGRPGADRP